MMLLDLVCFDCLMEQVKNGVPNETQGVPILTPFEPVNNAGIYEVHCSKGHISTTVIDNIDFEILFDYGLNAIADGFYRDAVSSFTSAMERYFEFFVKVALRVSKQMFRDIDIAWNSISSQSERQLGAYIALYNHLFKAQPLLLNQNKEVPFRNRVIHKGYIPSRQEALTYGVRSLEIIENSLIKLKTKYHKSTFETFDYYGYRNSAKIKHQKEQENSRIEKNFAVVNILTLINVKNGRDIHKDDVRNGDIESYLGQILNMRNNRKLTLKKGKNKSVS